VVNTEDKLFLEEPTFSDIWGGWDGHFSRKQKPCIKARCSGKARSLVLRTCWQWKRNWWVDEEGHILGIHTETVFIHLFIFIKHSGRVLVLITSYWICLTFR